MREIFREEFGKHTVITIVHRVSTILDCDVIFVLEKGRIVETGAPRDLLEKRGLFWELNCKSE
jgi:ATP-binding cassette, subfamily C (CFTR/MRP), member 1